MQIVNHGGQCCGIFHIYGMQNDPNSQQPGAGFGVTRLQHLNTLIEGWRVAYATRQPRLLEITLIDAQSAWFEPLRELGFSMTMSFLNGNTQNRVYTFHHHPDLTVYEPNAIVPAVAVVEEGLANYGENVTLAVGTRVQMNSPDLLGGDYGQYHGQIGEVTSSVVGSSNVRFDDGRTLQFWVTRFRPAPVIPAVAVPPVAAVEDGPANFPVGTRPAIGTRVQLNDIYFGPNNGLFGVVASVDNDPERPIVTAQLDNGRVSRAAFSHRFRPAPAEAQPEPVIEAPAIQVPAIQAPAIPGMPEGWMEDTDPRALAVGDRVIYHGRYIATRERIGQTGIIQFQNNRGGGDANWQVLFATGYFSTNYRNISRIIPIPVPAPDLDADNQGYLEALREERREILIEYFANLRNTGRRGTFSSRLEAVEAYPRCRRFDRRTVFSDGSIEWSDDV